MLEDAGALANEIIFLAAPIVVHPEHVNPIFAAVGQRAHEKIIDDAVQRDGRADAKAKRKDDER